MHGPLFYFIGIWQDTKVLYLNAVSQKTIENTEETRGNIWIKNMYLPRLNVPNIRMGLVVLHSYVLTPDIKNMVIFFHIDNFNIKSVTAEKNGKILTHVWILVLMCTLYLPIMYLIISLSSFLLYNTNRKYCMRPILTFLILSMTRK